MPLVGKEDKTLIKQAIPTKLNKEMRLYCEWARTKPSNFLTTAIERLLEQDEEWVAFKKEALCRPA